MKDDIFYVDDNDFNNIDEKLPDEDTIKEDEQSEFERELENYLPTFENTDKLKKKLPAWGLCTITSAIVCLVMMGIFMAFIMPYIRPGVVINYVEKYKHSEELKEQGTIADIYDKMSGSIVEIQTKTTYQNFFGISESNTTGSGVILTEDGYILTSNTLIGSSTLPTVILGDKTYTADVIGSDSSRDIAILKISEGGLTPATLANSEDVKVGDTSIVIGNVIGNGLGASVTRGIISGVNKNVPLKNGNSINLIQTDAVTNSNNAGGCILNSNGDIIGMITYAISSDAENISFAIPSNDIKASVETIIGGAKHESRLIIGISGSDSQHGVMVESVLEDTPAEKAGIKKGDLILKVDGKTVKSVSEINKIRDTHKKGESINITLYRGGETLEISIIL